MVTCFGSLSAYLSVTTWVLDLNDSKELWFAASLPSSSFKNWLNMNSEFGAGLVDLRRFLLLVCLDAYTG